MKFHLNSFNGIQLIERTQNSIANNQREIAPKISKAELWFLCMTLSHCALQLYEVSTNSFNSVQLTERTRNCIPRGIIWKIYKQELWFLCMTHRLNVLYKCMKFCWNIFNGYQVIEQTQFCDGQTDPQIDRRKGTICLRILMGGDVNMLKCGPNTWTKSQNLLEFWFTDFWITSLVHV